MESKKISERTDIKNRYKFIYFDKDNHTFQVLVFAWDEENAKEEFRKYHYSEGDTIRQIIPLEEEDNIW